MIKDANSDETPETPETPKSAYEQFEVLVKEGNAVLQNEDCPLCAGEHLFQLSGQVAPSFSFTNTDRYQRFGVFTFSFGPTLLYRATVAPGETYTLTSERMELFRLSLGEKVYGHLSVSVKWVIHLREDQKQRDVLAQAVTKFVEYYGSNLAEQARSAEAVVLALEDVHPRKRHVIIEVVFANQAGLVLTIEDYEHLFRKITNRDTVPRSLADLIRGGGMLIDSTLLIELMRKVSYHA